MCKDETAESGQVLDPQVNDWRRITQQHLMVILVSEKHTFTVLYLRDSEGGLLQQLWLIALTHAVEVSNERPPRVTKTWRNKYKQACNLQQWEFTNSVALLHCEHSEGLNVRVEIPHFLLCGLGQITLSFLFFIYLSIYFYYFIFLSPNWWNGEGSSVDRLFA